MADEQTFEFLDTSNTTSDSSVGAAAGISAGPQTGPIDPNQVRGTAHSVRGPVLECMCRPLAYRREQPSDLIWAMQSDNQTAPWKEAVQYLAVRALASKRQRRNSQVHGRDQLRHPSVENRPVHLLCHKVRLLMVTQEDHPLREHV